MDIRKYVTELASGAAEAARVLRTADTDTKNALLHAFADGLSEEADGILKANGRDVEAGKQKGISDALIDRLTLDEKRIGVMSAGLRKIADLADPVGEVIGDTTRPNELKITKVRVPIGVILIIYESRPNVTADAAGLCIKAGNAVILRGGSEAINSNLAIHAILKKALNDSGLPEGCASVVKHTDRDIVNELLQADEYINLVMPRGGEALIRTVVEKSRIPVIKHYKGVCHVYVDAACDMDTAVAISMNAKVQRPGVCNAMETLLVNESVADEFLARVAPLMKEAGVELRGCEKTRAILTDAKEAKEQDWNEEYLDLVLAVRVVADIREAVEHIERYGSSHSDAIVTTDEAAAKRFTSEVDSSAVYVNASTRFTDGEEFGMGAEIGISTDRLHARGPMGLTELTTYKYIVYGDGQIRT
jgi:glutamate-5-semialdehyde dehydrogenase